MKTGNENQQWFHVRNSWFFPHLSRLMITTLSVYEINWWISIIFNYFLASDERRAAKNTQFNCHIKKLKTHSFLTKARPAEQRKLLRHVEWTSCRELDLHGEWQLSPALSRYTHEHVCVCRILKSEFLFVFMALLSSSMMISQRGNAGSMSKQRKERENEAWKITSIILSPHIITSTDKWLSGLMITASLPRFMQRFCLFFMRLYKVIYQTWMRGLKRHP